MTPEEQKRYQRCAATVARIPQGVTDAEVDGLVTDLHRLPDTPRTSALTADAVQALAWTVPPTGFRRLRHLDPLLALVERHPPADPRWPATRACAIAFSLIWAAADRRITDSRDALRQLDELSRDTGGEPRVEQVLDLARNALRHNQALSNGDSAGVHRMLADAVAAAPGDPAAGLLARLGDLATAGDRGEDVRPLLAQVKADLAGLPPGHPLLAAMADVDALLEPLLAMSGDDGYSRPSDAQIAAMIAQAEQPHATSGQRALAYAAAGGALLGGGQESDPARVGRGVDCFRRALELSPPDDQQRPFFLMSVALGLFRRKELTGAVADIVAAEPLLVEARELAGGPHSPLWAQINDMLSHVQRQTGGGSPPRHTALDALRRHAYRGLLQTDRRVARKAALDAVEDALSAAHICLVDADPVAAVRALDSGRGLALFAATRLRDVTTLLSAADHQDLADRWRAAGGSTQPDRVPVELRQEVLQAITAGTGLLDPPGFTEIQGALRQLDGDALVYLVPARAPNPGWAVVVPAKGRPGYMALPNLRVDETDFEEFLTALRSRALVGDAREVGSIGGDGRLFRKRLDALCDWAWRAAIGPLLDAGFARATHRVPHLFLVPMGDLSRVPWHAARPHDGRYAVEVAAFSQTASARMLVDAARRLPVPPAPVGLVVGDPQPPPGVPDLAAARTEAAAIRRAFYLGGRYIGRPPEGAGNTSSGAGTATEVRAWLARPGPAGTLHLACHGFVDTAAAQAYLQLAADSETGESRLNATELIELMGSPAHREVGLVVLAACRTGLAMNGYDDAYSLGTAFLAGGARSVLSTLWSIPDRDTSVLMFMFHHYRMTERLPVWEALRRAQVWMLDSGREIPPSMPDQLRAQLDGTEPARVAAWAGFVHGGQ